MGLIPSGLRGFLRAANHRLPGKGHNDMIIAMEGASLEENKGNCQWILDRFVFVSTQLSRADKDLF